MMLAQQELQKSRIALAAAHGESETQTRAEANREPTPEVRGSSAFMIYRKEWLAKRRYRVAVSQIPLTAMMATMI